jgi:hypothetical protein
MSFNQLTPILHNALSYNQAGDIFIKHNQLNVRGDDGGYEGDHVQEYIELLAGTECGSYTSADNTTGTLYFPEVKFFIGFKNYSWTITGSGTLLEVEISAKSITGDDFAKNGTYHPGGVGSTSGNYAHLYHGDEIVGKFSRIAIYKAGFIDDRLRVRINKGPSTN